MRLSIVLAAAFSIFLTVSAAFCGEANYEETTSLAKSRQLGWRAANFIIKTLEAGDLEKYPGTDAWLKDFRKQTKGMDAKIAVDKWPKVDVDALMIHNPSFWQACYEIAPGDPGFVILYSGLLLSAGEASRALHVVELQEFRPGAPKEIQTGLRLLTNAAQTAGNDSNKLVKAGIEQFDKGEYADAIKKYREALKIWPQNGLACYELAYTLRTQEAIAAGEKPTPPGTVEVNSKKKVSADVKAMLAQSRCHTPFQYMAYQGDEKDVLEQLMGFKKIIPALKALKEDKAAASVNQSLLQLAEGCQEANIHDLALLTRQIIVARRKRFDEADHPFITTSLRKLAPGPATETTLNLLAGKELAFRQLVEMDEQKAWGDVRRDTPDGTPRVVGEPKVYEPKTKRPREDAEKNVQIDHIELVTPEDAIQGSATGEDMAKFVLQAEKIAREVFAKSQTSMQLMVTFKCSPSGHEVKIAYKPEDAKTDLIDKYNTALGKMEKLAVKGNPVEFRVLFSITPEKKAKDDKGKK